MAAGWTKEDEVAAAAAVEPKADMAAAAPVAAAAAPMALVRRWDICSAREEASFWAEYHCK